MQVVLLFLTQFWEDFGIIFVAVELLIYCAFLSLLTYVAIVRSDCDFPFPESWPLRSDMAGLITFSLFFLVLTASKWIEGIYIWEYIGAAFTGGA